MGKWLDWMILWVFSNLSDSMILFYDSELKKKKKAITTEEHKTNAMTVTVMLAHHNIGITT